MSAADHPEDASTASDVAARCRDAEFVRLVATPDGDALAATGILASALAARDVAFQTSVTWWPATDSEADLTVSVGATGGDVSLTDTTLAPAAADVATELDADPDATLALAGAVAAGDDPGEHAALLDEAGLDRDPGIAGPADDVADAMAHTTLAHAPFSGDPEETARTLAGVDREGRTLASLFALSVLETGARYAGEAVERALHPYALADRFAMATLAGYADVLDATARVRPGTGVALALGYDVRETALDGWREHARTVHGTVREATFARHDGLVVTDVTDEASAATLGSVARLVRDFRSPEPVVLAQSGGTAAVASAETDVTTLVAEAASAVGGEARIRAADGVGTPACAQVRVDETEMDAVVAALRRALP
ncbi:exonuclease RecJ [Halomarina rubra]|uniref:Exonuclease RecJ n=1 Tax=Halomarina rubra TaxID=2071873 RepID=A0ABD6ARA0_9EURY|nr:exonuclease RecJ [Halomarina rubra]